MVAKVKKQTREQLSHFQIDYWKIQNTTVINRDSIKIKQLKQGKTERGMRQQA